MGSLHNYVFFEIIKKKDDVAYKIILSEWINNSFEIRITEWEGGAPSLIFTFLLIAVQPNSASINQFSKTTTFSLDLHQHCHLEDHVIFAMLKLLNICIKHPLCVSLPLSF